MSGQNRPKPDLTETSPVDASAQGAGASKIGSSLSGVTPGDAKGATSGGSGGASGSKPNASDRTKAGNIETFFGRLVVDQGLVTSEEMQECIERQRLQIEENNQRSLVELLVESEYITRRQAARLQMVAEAERSGQQIPGYKVLDSIGAGAMATVYKAKQLSLDRMVAIKVLPKRFSTNTQFIERFYAEGRAAAQLNHPNIVQAYDVGKAGERHYFVMEFVDGRTVFDDITKAKRVPEKDAVEIAIQVTEALQHAHERGLIHRDVKPKNIMLTKSGVVKLADLGLARAVTDTEAAEAEKGKAFGTPYYISPEQIRGEVKIGPPADIYSLGATLFHMVTGQVPFDGKNPSDVMHQHLKADLRRPDEVNPKLSSGLSQVIEMMMAKDPRKRYQQCRDLLVDLRAVREGKSPPIAHQDIGGADLAALAKAEAAAPTEMVVSRPKASNSGVAPWLFFTMCALAVISVLVNIVQFIGRPG
jgi:eukaryotic-like serine/threonine-protein kinase